MTLILLVILVLVFAGGGYSGYRTYGAASGPYLGGAFGLILLLAVIYFLFGGSLGAGRF